MNQTAVDFIKRFEGCRLSAYLDSGNLPTIGWGATGPDVKMGLTWTQQQADDRLAHDVGIAQTGVRSLISRKLSESQEAALISFVFNLGRGALASSHLLDRVIHGDDIAASKAFLAWDHVGQEEIKGLLIRRLNEAALYLGGS